jgi:II/X family phage/plasmid replication protein
LIDTVKAKSPELPPLVLEAIAEQLQTRLCVDNASGEVLMEFTSGGLLGSFDHRTSIMVCREETRAVPLSKTKTGGRPDYHKVPCSHIIIEGSVHKAIQGINVCGGPADPRAAIRWYISTIAASLGVPLPDADAWEVMRVDVAECFDLGSFEACSEYISMLRLAKFPRRKMNNYGNQTVCFNGTTTGWKIYHKGPEFFIHDRKRMLPLFNHGELNFIQNYANGILRVETAIKLKKLQNDHHGLCLVKDITAEYVNAVYDQETLRVIRESEQDMITVRKNRDVRIRLFETHGERLGCLLYGTWLSLSAIGEEEVRKTMNRATFYRQRKQLQDAGVSWFGSDVAVTVSSIPDGFSLRRSDPRRIFGEADIVRHALMPFASAAA